MMNSGPSNGSLPIGRRIQIWRIERHMNREQLAARTGMSPYRLGRIERGGTRLFADELSLIATELDVSTIALMEEPMTTPTT